MAMFPINGPTIPGVCGALVKGECFVPSKTGTLIYFSVPDIDAALERIVAGGGKVLKPKTAIGPYGFIGHFEDCEGNGVALHSFA
jgi:predicted enzyme related to lactoylglutathione lyase